MQEPAQPTQQSPHQSATSNPNQQQELVMPPIDLASRYGPNSSAIKLVIEIEFIHLVSFRFRLLTYFFFAAKNTTELWQLSVNIMS